MNTKCQRAGFPAGCTLLVLFLCGAAATAENVDPYQYGEQYGWSENTGWLNAEPSVGGGMQVEADRLTGWVWGENIGWINLSCRNNNTCKTVSFGVVNDGAGNLSGFAWGENVGWINFDPAVPGETKLIDYRVRIDSGGKLTGWAWGENVGWIRFDNKTSWSVRVCIVTLEDLANFAADWLETGALPANLDRTGNVDLADFSAFSTEWLDYCPDGWQLK